MNPMEPRAPGKIGAAFSHYLGAVYRAKAKLMPTHQRAELEQAFNAGAQFLLVQLGSDINRGAPRGVMREQMKDHQTELDGYARERVRMLEIDNRLRLVRRDGNEVKQ